MTRDEARKLAESKLDPCSTWRVLVDGAVDAILQTDAAAREEVAKLAENVYGDEVQAMGGRNGDEPKAVGRKIAAAIRATIKPKE